MWIYEQTMTNLANSVWSPHQTDLLRCYWNLMDGYIIYFVIYTLSNIPITHRVKILKYYMCVNTNITNVWVLFHPIEWRHIWKIPQSLSRTVPRAIIKFIKFFPLLRNILPPPNMNSNSFLPLSVYNVSCPWNILFP